MILSIDMTLRGVADMMRSRLAPAIDDKFAGETARLAEMLIRLSAEWVDDAVAIRVAETQAIRALFAEAAPKVVDPSLASRLEHAAQASDPGFRISEMESECDRLRALLAELLAQIEVDEPLLAQRIWRLLESLETARAPR